MLEQSWLDNHEINYIEAAEKPLRFPHYTPLLIWRYLHPRRGAPCVNLNHPICLFNLGFRQIQKVFTTQEYNLYIELKKTDFKNNRIRKQTDFNSILFPNTTDSKKQKISKNNKYLKTIPNSNQKKEQKKQQI